MYISSLEVTDEALTKFKSKLRKEGDCMLWTGCVTAEGYGRMYCRALGRVDVRRFRWLSIHGLEGDERISTICGNKLCCNPEHLYDSTAGSGHTI